MKLGMVLEKAVYTAALTACIALGFTACGDMNASEVDMGSKRAEAGRAEEEIGQEAEGRKAEKTEQEEQEESNPEDNQENKTASYEYKDIAMSIELPSEWDYEVKTVKKMKKQDSKLCAIDFWLREKPELTFEFAYWKPNSFGLCGTGITTEEVSFENGLSAWKHTEESDNVIWFMLVYKMDREKGNFTVEANMDKKLWEEYEDDIMEVLGMISFTEPKEK